MTRATIRTYRHGLGDCHLVTLMGKDNKAPYRILIDCGVILGTPDAAAKMTAVMDDVVTASNGRIDLLVATHEHWDHVSGFVQAADSFAKLKVGEVWLAWTEDPQDKDAKELAASKGKALAMLQDSALHLQQTGSTANPLFVSLAEFFGMAAGATTRDALEAVRSKAKKKNPGIATPPTHRWNCQTLMRASTCWGRPAIPRCSNAWTHPARTQKRRTRTHWPVLPQPCSPR